MTIKATSEGDLVAPETMADRLRSVQSEPWRHLRYTDENQETAWDVYHESMFLRGPGAGESEETEELEGKVPKFESKWEEQQLLEAVSGIQKPKVEEQVVVKKLEKQIKEQEAEEKKPKTGRTRGGGNAGPSRRGGRPKGSTSKTVQID